MEKIRIDNWEYMESHVKTGSQPYNKMHSLLNVNAEKDMFLYSNRAENNRYILNGDTLEHRQYDQLNFYPVHLKYGENELTALIDTIEYERHIKLELCDSACCIRLMNESMFGRMFYPLIDSDSLTLELDKQYYNVMPIDSRMEIFNVAGEKTHGFPITDNSLKYPVPQLKEGHSYICKWTIGNNSAYQTLVCGNPDAVYAKFNNLAVKVHLNHDDSIRTDQILGRFKFLLDHPSRKDDWWWQFKIAPLTYQLESIFDKASGLTVREPTLKFETYKSPLDGNIQRCIVFTPANLDKEYPLIVMIRPAGENYHDFFSCPQLARQWAVNNAQMLCDKYGFIMIIPEGRMPKSGYLSRLMEDEILSSIDTMAEIYPIDKDHIFLHANCSGGERALQIASHHPEMFKGMGLYAPYFNSEINRTYPINRQINLKALKKIPMFVQGDPLDKHSPLSFYKDLISGMEKIGNPCSVNMDFHSGENYNVFLIGEEALQFFCNISKPTR